MKKIPIVILLAAALTLTACGKTETVSDGVPESAPGYIPPTVPVSEESSAEIPESSSESFSETSDASLESEPEKITECPYNVGDPVGPEDLPSRNAAAYIVTETARDGETGEVRFVVWNIYDKYDNILAIIGEDSEYYYSYEYDEDGNIKRQYNGSAENYEENEYKDGLTSKYTVFTGGKAQYEVELFYDEHGTLVKDVSHFFADDSTTTAINMKAEYDDRGNLSRAVYLNSSGEEREIDVLEYNENDECIKSVRTMKPGTEKEYTVTEIYTYDDKGSTLSRHFIKVLKDGTVSLEYRDEYEYNSDNRKTEERHFVIEDGTETLKTVTGYEYET